jgi:hypothetical protein
MICSECKKKEAVKKFYDPVGVYDVCQPCFDTLDYEEWSYGMDSTFGNMKEAREDFKEFLVLLLIIGAIIAIFVLF